LPFLGQGSEGLVFYAKKSTLTIEYKKLPLILKPVVLEEERIVKVTLRRGAPLPKTFLM